VELKRFCSGVRAIDLCARVQNEKTSKPITCTQRDQTAQSGNKKTAHATKTNTNLESAHLERTFYL
jgi:hypothetical protein